MASAVLPYLSAVAGAYGSAVVQRVSDGAADATADATLGAGRRLARRLFGSSRSSQVQSALVDLAGRPGDEGLADVLRAQVRAALAADLSLLADVVQLLRAAGGKFEVSVSNSQGVQVGDGNTQTNTFNAPPR
ncbi:hypothetical protein [Dactylosporangium darangshiense]|uniref:hypothetical protein n=1 Tax=Dactylosporangium darangshiense TaxID=579108 RepID=UPI0031EBB0B3